MNTAEDFSVKGHILRYIILLMAVFFSNGLLMFGFKLNEMLYPSASKACFVAAIYSGATIVFLLGGVFLYRHNNLWHLQKCELKWGIAMGICTIASVLLLQAAMSLPAIVVFPIAQGIALIGGITLMAFVYKERINKFKATGIVLGLIVLLQAIFR